MTRGNHTDVERAERIKSLRSQIGKLESARIVVDLEGPRAVTEATFEVVRSCSEWLKEVRNAEPLVGLNDTEAGLRACQHDAEQCLEDAHAACRADMA
ncbi:hypothetical protein AMK31_26285 [Streptomyces sp. TSRI0107]|nr:hypothetical protein AMK31_26285 [Streptomyces sp. TSRI0107]